MFRHFFAAIISFGLLSSSICHAQELTRELLDKIKAAAIYIEVSHRPDGMIEGSGSGWIFEKDAKGILVMTNRHVVVNDEDHKGKVECIFFPGTDKEKRLAATIVVVDPDEDLAVLRVEGADLPAAMPLLQDADSLFETMRCFTVGYPLGKILASGRRSPSVTIVDTTINALRRLDNNMLARINLNGGVQPGNSGGMVVSAKGEVIGVVNALSVFTDNISVAIPISQVHVLLNGKPEKIIGIPAVSNDPSKVIVDFYCNCFDPKGGIEKIEFLHGSSTLLDGQKPDQIAMMRSPLAGMSAPILMKYDPSRAQAHCRVTFDAAALQREVIFQVTTYRKDRIKFSTSPIATKVDSKKQFTFSPGYKESVEVASSGGRGVTGDTKTIKMDHPVSEMIVAGSGRYVLIRAGGDVAVVDLTKRERVKSFNISEESLIAGGANCFVVYNSFSHKFEKWSLESMSKVLEVAPPRDLKPIEMALGHSSNGPLFVYDIPKIATSAGIAKLSCAFLDLEAFKGKIDVFFEGPLPQTQGGRDGLGALVSAEIRAAGNGSLFTMWRPRTIPQGMAVFRNKRVKGGKLAIDTEEDTGLYVVPSTDGETICTLLGAKSNDLKRDKMSGIFLPCTDVDHILSFSPKGFDLRSTSSGSTVKSFEPIFPELGKSNVEKGAIEFFLGLDKRIICSPQYDMMAISFPGTDTVAISKLGLNLPASPTTPVAGPATKIANGAMRTWTDVTGAHQTRAKLLSVSTLEVELSLENGGTTRKIPLDKLSEADVRYAKAEAQKASAK